MKRPFTDSRILAYVESLKRDNITDWDLYYEAETNPFLKNKIDAFFNTERQEEELKAKERQAAHFEKEALATAKRHRFDVIKQTCRKYHGTRKAFYNRRKGLYNRLKYLQASQARNERFKASNWIMFTASVMGHRKNQVLNWTADSLDAEYVINQLSDPLNPWEGVRWPWYSSCAITPVPTDKELTLRYGPEVFETKSSLLAQLKYHKQQAKRLTLEINS